MRNGAFSRMETRAMATARRGRNYQVRKVLYRRQLVASIPQKEYTGEKGLESRIRQLLIITSPLIIIHGRNHISNLLFPNLLPQSTMSWSEHHRNFCKTMGPPVHDIEVGNDVAKKGAPDNGFTVRGAPENSHTARGGAPENRSHLRSPPSPFFMHYSFFSF